MINVIIRHWLEAGKMGGGLFDQLTIGEKFGLPLTPSPPIFWTFAPAAHPPKNK